MASDIPESNNFIRNKTQKNHTPYSLAKINPCWHQKKRRRDIRSHRYEVICFLKKALKFFVKKWQYIICLCAEQAVWVSVGKYCRYSQRLRRNHRRAEYHVKLAYGSIGKSNRCGLHLKRFTFNYVTRNSKHVTRNSPISVNSLESAG
jgi:hypothetical protein